MKNERKDPALKMPTPAEIGGTQHSTALKKLLVDGVKDIYWAEQELLKVLPNMQQAATTNGLKKAIQEHIIQTQDHVTRLENVFELCGVEPQAKPCEAMQGLINEGQHILSQTESGTMTRDAAIIFASQKIEHYEIATYGGLLEFARTLGYRDVAGYFNLTLDEEKQADQGLSLIAQTGINWNAEHEKETAK
ncbi:MAG: ferritin-like domain-containing protein [Chitinophagaceae bacterium]|nr:ferritin-like domain-containing protein [Chitinophagaceae bacterium]